MKPQDLAPKEIVAELDRHVVGQAPRSARSRSRSGTAGAARRSRRS